MRAIALGELVKYKCQKHHFVGIGIMKYRTRLLVRALEDRITPMAGQLDPSFGNGGLVTTRFPVSSNDSARSVAIDGLGRIVVAGSSEAEFAVTRYTTGGALDTSFGGTGIITIPFNSTAAAYGVAIDSLNRVIVAGRIVLGTESDFALARLTAAGTLDTSFNGSGRLTIDFGGTDIAYGVAVDSQDRIVVAGYTTGFNDDFAVARLTVAGALDTSFDGDGKQIIDFGGSNDRAYGVAIDSQDRVVIAGYKSAANHHIAVARLTSAGALDTGFNGNGKQTVAFGAGPDDAYGVAVDSMDRVVVAGSTYNGSTYDHALARLTSTGVLDSSYDSNGKLTIASGATFSYAYSVAVDSQDRAVVATLASNATDVDFGVFRVTSIGALDASFNGNGQQSVNFGPTNDLAYGVAVDSLDRIVVAGQAGDASNTKNDFAVARLTVAGALDISFNGNGKITNDLANRSTATACSVAIDNLGRTIVAGFSDSYDLSTSVMAISRYTQAGILDLTFAGTGMVTIPFSPYGAYAFCVAVDSLNRIIVAGSGHLGIAVARLTSSGALDTSFDADGTQTISFGPNGAAAYGVAIDSMDRVVVAGITGFATNYSFAVARLTSAGMLDTSFNGNGTQTIAFASGNDWAYGLAIDSMDRVVVAGKTPYGSIYDFDVARLTAAGALDTSFNATGKETIAFPGGAAGAYGVAIDSMDRIVVAGVANNGSNRFAVARLTPAGALDTSFNGTGQQTIAIGAAGDIAYNVAVDSMNRVVLSGQTYTGSKYDFAVARLTSSGSLDTGFNGNGKQSVDFGTVTADVQGMAIDSFGRVVVAGQVQNNGQLFGVFRLTGDTPPSKLASVTVNDGAAQRSMVTSLKVAFDSKVSFVGSPANAFQLNRQSDDAAVNLSAVLDASGTFVTLTFTGGAVDLAGSLADGRYTLKILASQFGGLGFDGNGNGLADLSPSDDYVLIGDPATNKLFRMYGDVNGDGTVSASDFILFRQAFSGVSFAFDFDGDGGVTDSDFIQFRLRFGGSI
jgi:uncharacterized delta-60 repeat protein